MMAMPIRLAVFDIAGTTVNDPDGVGGCLKEALDAANVPWDADEVRAIMGLPKPIAIADLMRWADLPADDDQVSKIHDDFQQRMKNFYRSDPEVFGLPGALETFVRLREKGIKTALDTGFDRSIVEILLERLGWETGVVDFTVCSDEVPRGRPFPDLILRAMELTGVTNVAEVAKLGDTMVDLQEGTAAGCSLVIGLTTGNATREELALHPHTHILDSLSEAAEVILAQG